MAQFSYKAYDNKWKGVKGAGISAGVTGGFLLARVYMQINNMPSNMVLSDQGKTYVAFGWILAIGGIIAYFVGRR